jgi:hypothetical protein
MSSPPNKRLRARNFQDAELLNIINAAICCYTGVVTDHSGKQHTFSITACFHDGRTYSEELFRNFVLIGGQTDRTADSICKQFRALLTGYDNYRSGNFSSLTQVQKRFFGANQHLMNVFLEEKSKYSNAGTAGRVPGSSFYLLSSFHFLIFPSRANYRQHFSCTSFASNKRN